MRGDPDHRAAEPVGRLVVVGLLIGALVGAWWSVARPVRSMPQIAVQSAQLTSSDPTAGWPVDPGVPWQADVVRITTERCGDEIRGSGVVIDGAVVTNRHVVEGGTRVRITMADGSSTVATALSISTEFDLARITAPGLPDGLGLAQERPIAMASFTLAGFPGGGTFSTRRVTIDAVERGWGFPDPSRSLRLGETVVPGESGSPLVDGDGDVAGLLYASSNADGAGLAIGGDELRTELGKLGGLGFVVCPTDRAIDQPLGSGEPSAPSHGAPSSGVVGPWR